MRDNYLKLEFISKSTNESFARAAISAFVAQLDPTIEEISDIKTAVSEAVTNCIVHAYADSFGKVFITVKILNNNVVLIKVRDKGIGIPDIDKAREPLFTTGGEERAGLGFAVMESFMDKIRVNSSKRGTSVSMYKKLCENPLKKLGVK